MKKVLVFCAVLGILFWMNTAIASELAWEPINPSFGGSPFNGQWLMNSAQIQDPHGFLKSEPREIPKKDPLERFQERLTDRVFYRLSGQIVDAAFGEEGLEEGQYTVGQYLINVSTDETGILTVITDTETGNTTSVQIPYY